MGRARETRGLADPTRVPAWTREQIEAWVRGEFGDVIHAGADKRALLRERAAIVRLCPEAPDYEKLSRRLRCSWAWIARRPSATDAEIDATVEGMVAALWSQSLSEPSDGEAPG